MKTQTEQTNAIREFNIKAIGTEKEIKNFINLITIRLKEELKNKTYLTEIKEVLKNE